MAVMIVHPGTEFVLSLRKQLEHHVFNGCSNVLFMPDGRCARWLAETILRVSDRVRVTFADVLAVSANSRPAAFDDIDVVVVCTDGAKVEVLSNLNAAVWNRLPHVVVAGVQHQQATLNKIATIEERCEIASQAVGNDLVKAHLYDALRSLRHRYTGGIIAEMGTFRGGTLILLAEMMDELSYAGPTLVGFDTFAGFPSRRRLLDLFAAAKFEERDVATVKRRMEARGIGVVQGDIVETANQLAGEQILMTFFDTDNYSATAVALPICFENTVPGGFLIFDHYYTRTEYLDTIGEHVAAAEFFAGRDDYLHITGTGVFMKLPVGV